MELMPRRILGIRASSNCLESDGQPCRYVDTVSSSWSRQVLMQVRMVAVGVGVRVDVQKSSSKIYTYPDVLQHPSGGKKLSSPTQMLQQTLEAFRASLAAHELRLADFRETAAVYVELMEEEIARARRTIEVLEKEVTKAEADSIGQPNVRRTVTHAVGRVGAVSNDTDDSGRKESQSQTIRSNAEIVLREAKRPLKQSEIWRALVERGITISSADPVELVRAALRRAPGFRHIPRRGYVWEGD